MNLAEEKVSKLLLRFSIPAIIGMMVNALYSVVDRIYISRGVGTEAFSSLTVAMPITFILMAFGMLVGFGAAALISIKLGEGKKEEAENILGNGFMLLVLISIFTTVIFLIFLKPLLLLFGATENTLGYAKDFMFIIIAGSIFQIVGFGMNNMLRSVGKPKQAMITMLIGAILNGVILEPLFIFVFHWGIKGSAAGTVIAQAVSMIWVLSYFFNKKSMIRVHKKYLKLKTSIILKIFSIGMSSFAMQVAGSIVGAVANYQLVKYGGDLALGAFGLLNSVAMLFMMPIFGINQGSQPIIGFNYGAGRYDRVKEVLKYTVTAATLVCIFCWAMVEFAPIVLIHFFTEDQALTEIAKNGMRIMLFTMPIVGVQVICSSFFQAIGQATTALVLGLLRQVILLIPLLLIVPTFLQLNGVWLSGPIGDFISAIVTVIVFYNTIKKMKMNTAPVNK